MLCFLQDVYIDIQTCTETLLSFLGMKKSLYPVIQTFTFSVLL